MERPILAIIGRPNVGKSHLFNRIIGRRVAIVQDEPGVTRDRNYARCDFQGTEFTIVDTGGLELAPPGGIVSQVRLQVQQAIQEADLLLLVVDGSEGVTPVDEEILDLLRRTSKPVLCAVNKIDRPKGEKELYDFYQLGLDPLYPISAEHGHGVAELLEQAVKLLPPSPPTEALPPLEHPKVAVVGRPNVGKSTLINRILGEERLLTSEIPGTTRDAIDTVVEYKNKKYVLIDTAGMRRRGRIVSGVERFSVGRALKSIQRCDLALLLVDGQEGIVEQDTKIAGEILRLGKGCILLINKWDLCQKDRDAPSRFQAELARRFPFMPFVPTLFVSALSSKKIPQIFATIDRVISAYTQRITTGDLNRFFEAVVKNHPPPSRKGYPVRLYYVVQAQTRPPVFVAFCNRPSAVSPPYLRYLENQLRATFGFVGVPMRIIMRKRR